MNPETKEVSVTEQEAVKSSLPAEPRQPWRFGKWDNDDGNSNP